MANKDRGDTKYSLFMRWVITNAFGLMFIGVAWKTGWIQDVVALDSIYLSRGIMLYGFYAWVILAWKIYDTSRELNIAQDYDRFFKARNTKACETIEGKNSRLSNYLSDVKGMSAEGRREMGEMLADDLESTSLSGSGYKLSRLTALGSIGLLFGIGVALKVFEIPLTDTSQVMTVFNKIPTGLRIAVYPPLIATIVAIWIDHPFEILEDGTSKLILWIKKAGVQNAELKDS